MSRSASLPRALERLASLPVIVAWGFGLRVVAALVVQAYADRKGTLCVFDDTAIYWQLARAIRAGGPYVVDQWGVPHYALRTPGYPLFLAVCQSVLGEHVFSMRIIQAGLGAGCVWLLARLVEAIRPEDAGQAGWTTPKIAAAWAATDPYVVGMSALILAEALFVPWMLLALWGLAVLWSSHVARPALALATGAAAGAAILVRPSWAQFVPLALVAWVASTRRWAAIRGAALVVLGVVVAMGPWWWRNARVLGRFVPTALWIGASLYDGLHPGATGGSDMAFLAEPDVRALDEPTQDATLRARAVAFARAQPGRALELTAIKAARFWSPWPNAEAFQSRGVALAGAVVTIPFYLFLILGAWDCRRDARALVLLLGPLLVFAALHLVFVGSIRYRIPATVPALGLAAIGVTRIAGRRRDRHEP